MIKKRVQKIVLSVMLLASPLMAESLFEGTSLVAIESSFGAMNTEISDANNVNAYSQDKTDLVSLGLKIGAQSQNYRVFLSTRYYVDPLNDYEYVASLGAEVQYLFNISSKNNIFIGINGGIISSKFAIPAESFSRTISDPYLGADIGMNFHMRKTLDFEIGTRIMNVQAVNLKNDVTYRLNNMVSAYASLIFKWTAN